VAASDAVRALPKGASEALRAAEKARVLAPLSPTPWIALGGSYWALGKTKEARAAYERALALSPNSQAALRNLSALDRQTGNHRNALSLLRNVLTLDPRSEDGRKQLDRTIIDLVQEMLWFSLPIGLVLAIVTYNVWGPT
jgi:tetratricopeptide (TPR) repeat protein